VKSLTRYTDNGFGATKVSSEASTAFAIDRYSKKSMNKSSYNMEAQAAATTTTLFLKMPCGWLHRLVRPHGFR
jgi:hypothetical protein